MNHTLLAAICFALTTGCAASNPNETETKADVSQSAAYISARDFELLEGDRWTGTLSYLDYTKGTTESIPVELKFDTAQPRSVSYSIKYPGEAQYNAREKLKWSKDGTRLEGARIVSRKNLDTGGIEIATEEIGTDDGRPATIRMTYTLSADLFLIRKDIRFDDTDVFFNRNEYELAR